MKKKALLLTITSFSLVLGALAGLILTKGDNAYFANAKDDSYWFHYNQVNPTNDKHGSKEFWANCSTHNFSLETPGLAEDIREGVAFNTTTYFDELSSDDPRYLPPLSERVDIWGYVEEAIDGLNASPEEFIPNSMKLEYVEKVSSSSVDYDFTVDTPVSDIHYGGFGEQWHMVIENIEESKKFYKVITIGTETLTACNLVVSAFLDDYYENTISKTFTNGSSFNAKLDFDGGVLSYSIQYISGIEIPFFGTVIPQIDLKYELLSQKKTGRIQLGEGNALKYESTPNSYILGIEYGVGDVARTAYFSVEKDGNDEVEGHIYEYVDYGDKTIVNSCADFYIDEDYVSVVGNKASGMVAFTGYINELYDTENGKLLGYGLKEELSKITYNNYYFNLDNIFGLDSIKEVDDKFYVNGSATEFKSKKYGGANLLKTGSRRYYFNYRKQYFYNEVNDELLEYETTIPMMCIQQEKFSEFTSDVAGENSGLSLVVNVSQGLIDKIQSDYDVLIPEFDSHKDDVTGANIVEYIGDKVEF